MGSKNCLGVRTLPIVLNPALWTHTRNRFEYVGERTKKYEFWIGTAQVGAFSVLVPSTIRADCYHKACRRLNNFSSTDAIVTALSSSTITDLVLTCECESKATRQALNRLIKELAPTDGSYRNTIHRAATKELIPWLGMIGLIPHCQYLTPMSIDPFLTSLNSTFVQSNLIMELDSHPLVDFKLLSELAAQVDSIVQYTPPRFENATRQDVLAYVEYSLKLLTMDDVSQVSTEAISARLAQEERKMFEHRGRMRSLGIPWSPQHRK